MAKITGILPPSAVFMFALHRPPLISGPWQRGTYLPQWASLPGTYVATMGNLERGREGRLKTPVPHRCPAMVTVWSLCHECL